MGKGFHTKVLKDGDAAEVHQSPSVLFLLSDIIRVDPIKKKNFQVFFFSASRGKLDCLFKTVLESDKSGPFLLRD